MAGTSEIDLVKYGILCEKVDSMEKKIAQIEEKMDQLLELANRGKGGLWLGMTMVAVLSTVIGLLIKFWKG